MSNSNQSLCTCGCCDEGTPHTPLKTENLPGLSALRYRAGTHSSFKESMLRALSQKQALNKLTSRYDDDMAVATLDAWATVLDVLTFYQERIINEGYLRTSTERMSVLELARHISYTLAPGVAAGTFLMFGMNESPGAPAKALIPVSTKVQSVPEQDQLPQLFETTEAIEAKVEWNGIRLQTRKRILPVQGARQIFLAGISTGLQAGDGILMIGDDREANLGSEKWDFRKVKEAIPDPEAGYTRVTWDTPLGTKKDGSVVAPDNKGFKFFSLKQRASLFGYNAPDFRSMSEEIKDSYNSSTNEPNSNTDWKDFDIKSIAGGIENKIYLDALYPKILKDSWLVIMTAAKEEVYRVSSAVESSRKDFMLTSKSMALDLLGEAVSSAFNTNVRDAIIFAQSEELEIAARPVTNSIHNYKELTLEKLTPGLTAGKVIIISGKRRRIEIPEPADELFLFTVEKDPTVSRLLRTGDNLIILKKPVVIAPGVVQLSLRDSGGYDGTIDVIGFTFIPVAAGKDDEVVSELHTIESIKPGTDPTVIILKDLIANLFDSTTVTICANVAAATHGETKQETLGSGNGSQLFQKFELKQAPLTYISAATVTGTKTTLQIRVNDILWKEVPSFYGAKPTEKVYVVKINDEGKITVMFGDGITGSRLPTGTENIKATYRVGIGTAGLVNAGQLSMLMTPQPGVNKVVNPLPASGAEDPEIIDRAKQNAPLTVLTLDRIVSAKDFEDFTRAFAGIGKARAEILWSGEKQVVQLTIAADGQLPIAGNSALYTNLVAAIHAAGHSNQTIYIDNYIPASFSMEARIKVGEEYLFDVVKANVEQVLKETFSFSSRDFGQDVTAAEIIAAIQNVEGVVYADLQALNGTDPFALPTKFRLPSGVARWENNTTVAAELLIINEKEIIITEIPT